MAPPTSALIEESDADFLLVPAGERPHLLLGPARTNAERSDPMTRLPGLRGLGDKESPDITLLERDDHVLAQGQFADDPLLFPVCRDKSNAGGLRGTGGARPIGRAGNACRAADLGSERAIERASERFDARAD